MTEAQQFYDANADYEWKRLERHPHEFALNMAMLAEYLPKAPCRVLDVGGGPGRYSISLARLGYRVTLFDLSAACLTYARQRAAEAGVTVDGFVHGNALDLGAFPDGHFDAVLLMGPMYHLLKAGERAQALAEARRVLKPGGVLAVAFINRLSRVRHGNPEVLVRNLEQVKREIATGFKVDIDGLFTDTYTAHPAEVRPLLEVNGFTFIEMIASEGMREVDEPVGLTGADWENWVALQYQVAKDPTVQGAAIHLFAVARRSEL